MSGGVLAAVIVAVFLLCCVVPGAAIAILVNRLGNGEPDAEITACRITDGVVVGGAQVEYSITNNDATARSFTVDIEVVDKDGARVGSISDFVPTVGSGVTARENAILILPRSGGKTCRIAKIT